MAREIEKKYLVNPALWRPPANGVRIRQGYLNSAKERVVRVRITGDRSYLTIKGITQGISRLEFEYEIPSAEAEQLLTLCEQPLIEKIRYEEKAGDHIWEIDQFLGANQGLIIAEVELAQERDAIECPAWVGQEVSDDPRYFNSNLILHPYIAWEI